ncbi:MAG: VCBS domain-containing protein [Clostridia bacterium]|nr:VCBS domain-containing protein [Clostridia bacterium]
MKKIGFFGLLIFWLLCLGMTVNAALLSPALSVMQDDFEMIKTGVGTNTVSFSQSDFVSVLGSGDFPGIAVQSLPDPSDGILKLGMEDVREGQIIERDMLDALRFIPAEPGKTAVFDFLPCETAYEKPFVCTVYMLDTLNFAPSAQACTVSAKENIAVYGSLSASDPDGDEITYHTVSAPRYGELSLSADGSFVYTAREGTSADSFSYYVCDRYGNRSEAAVVSISTTANASGIVYADLAHSEYALPAAVLAEKGAFIGEKLGDEWIFSPDKTVTRADFLMMAMRMCDIDANLIAANQSGFADSDTFTPTQNRYISVATGMGLVIGLDTENGRCFCPNEPITSEQASTLLGRIAQYKELSFGKSVAASIDGDGVISDDGIAMLASVGLVTGEDRKAELTRADVARLLYTLTEKD